MARHVRDSRLETREARARLKARDEPYWRLIHEGLHLGYRKRVRGAVWLERRYLDGRYIKRNLGRSDDHEDANGQTVLSFREAQQRALEASPGGTGPYTVAKAMQDYLAWYGTHRKALKSAQYVIEADILPSLGERPAAALTAQEIRQWHEALAARPARVRRGRFTPAKSRETNDPRARRSTANRILTVLKAALNRAYRDGRAGSDDAWRRVSPFHNVEAPRVRYLTEAECARLCNACAPDFRPLVQAALLTGLRYGELVRLVAADFNPDAGAVWVRESKSGKPRHVPLTDEGQRFFTRAAAYALSPRSGGRLFTRGDGKPWGTSHQRRPLAAACERAGISPAVSFHVLRHTYGSLLAMGGVPLQAIAEALGHADTRVTSRHYAHLLPSYVADMVRKHLPSFGVESANITPLNRRGAESRLTAKRRRKINAEIDAELAAMKEVRI